MNADDLSANQKLEAELIAELQRPIEPRPESPTLEDRIAKLEEENARLREILTEIADLAGGGAFPVLGVEIALRLGQWANGD